jgi:hypothetical protein
MSETATLEREAPSLADEPDRVEAIRSLFDKIDQAEQTTDEVRWSAAQLVAAEVADGKTTRDLAAELDRSAMYVSRYNRAWKAFQEDPSVRDRSFSRAYTPTPTGVTRVTEPGAKPQTLVEALDNVDLDGLSLTVLRDVLAAAESLVERVAAEIDAAEGGVAA